MIMNSGAGHDAMKFAEICPTGMVFIPCRNGISHNKEEKINDIAFWNILNSRSMLLEQPDYKKQRKIHSEEGKDDEQTD